MDQLTPRERDVLRLLAQGMTNQEIADALCIAESTVRTHHISSLLSKLYASNRVQLALYAHGLWRYAPVTDVYASQEGAQHGR